MAKQTIGIGTTADDGTGDTLRAAFAKVNANTTELYDSTAGAQIDADSAIFSVGTLASLNTVEKTNIVSAVNEVIGSIIIRRWSSLSEAEKAELVLGDLVLDSNNTIQQLSTNAANTQLAAVANTAARDAITGMAHGDHVIVSDTGRQNYYTTLPTTPAWVETTSFQIPTVPSNGKLNPNGGVSSWAEYASEKYKPEVAGRSISPRNNRYDKREYNLNSGDALFQYPEDLPEGFVIEWNVPYVIRGKTLDLVINDGAEEKFAGLDGIVADDGRVRITNQAGTVAFRKTGSVWKQFKANHYNVTTGKALSISGSIDASSAYVLRVSVDEALYGAAPYSNYTVVISLLHADYSGRTITLTGNDLSLAPLTVVDTAPANKVTLTYASTYVGPDGVVIGGVARNNGATSIKALYGTLGSFDLVSNIARLYGDINISISVSDSGSSTATETL